MMFAAPWVLLALLALPVLWWLLRATPRAASTEFPAVRLLAALRPREETPARTPWWLLALRLAAAALIIIGLAGPILGGAARRSRAQAQCCWSSITAWSAGPDWSARLAAAHAVLDQADRKGTKVALLATAAGFGPPRATAFMQAALLRPTLSALAPAPWGTDRRGAAQAVGGLPRGPSIYVADGVAGPDDSGFASALAARGPLTELRGALPARLLSVAATPAGLTALLSQTSVATPRQEEVLAETGDGRVLARTALDVAAGAVSGSAPVKLPTELRNQLAVLRLAQAPGAGSVALLDEAARRGRSGC